MEADGRQRQFVKLGHTTKQFKICQVAVTLMETIVEPADFSISTLTSLPPDAATSLFKTLPLVEVLTNDFDLNPKDLIFSSYQSVITLGSSLLSNLMPLSELSTDEEFGYLKSDKSIVWEVEERSFTSWLTVTGELFEEGEALGEGVGVGGGSGRETLIWLEITTETINTNVAMIIIMTRELYHPCLLAKIMGGKVLTPPGFGRR